MELEGNRNKIFISWSGENSKRIALELKDTLEKIIFTNGKIDCFVSARDIESGEEWYQRVKNELASCSLGIACVTKDNLRAPWIYFETGAITAREIKVIPLLINCHINELMETPLKQKQAQSLNDQEQFKKLVNDINNDLSIVDSEDYNLNALASVGYNHLMESLKDIILALSETRRFGSGYIYPQATTTIRKNSLYISAEISSVDDSTFEKEKQDIEKLIPVLKGIGFNEITSPISLCSLETRFDGNVKAIRNNFSSMKSAECFLAIMPAKASTSVLTEIGYAIALSKQIVIFHHDKLPYLLEESDQGISHVKLYSFDNFDEIERKLKANGMALFESDEIKL